MKIKIIKNRNKSDYKNWSIWECKPSKFDWKYDQEEHCFIINGDAIISTSKEIIQITNNDFVIFPKGLQCNWEVKKAIKKYYSFI